MSAHRSPSSPFLLRTISHPFPVAVFAFPASWSTDDWILAGARGGPFRESEIDASLFPSLKNCCLSLLHPSPSSSSPLCDICQERRGFLFCQEDRAILCTDCNIPVHTTNNLTMNHHRFLLTGVRLSSTPIPSAPPLEVEVMDKKTNNDDAKIKNNCYESNKNIVAAKEEGRRRPQRF